MNEISYMTPPNGTRMVLTQQQAQDIFRLRESHGFQSLHAASVSLAKEYKVSPKAIRDIWKGRSWLDATFDLWGTEERPTRKVLGRPKGRKDSRPRQTKASKYAKRENGPFPNFGEQQAFKTEGNFGSFETLRSCNESSESMGKEFSRCMFQSAPTSANCPLPVNPLAQHGYTHNHHLFGQDSRCSPFLAESLVHQVAHQGVSSLMARADQHHQIHPRLAHHPRDNGGIPYFDPLHSLHVGFHLLQMEAMAASLPALMLEAAARAIEPRAQAFALAPHLAAALRAAPPLCPVSRLAGSSSPSSPPAPADCWAVSER